MESLSFALSGKFYRLLPFKLSIKSWWFFVLFASYSFLSYKLLTFNQYQELAIQWKQMPLSQLWWFGCVCVLLPVNWLLEAVKWKLLTSKVQKINLRNSFKAVLAGISTGFITPNRVGELVGRVMFLHNENRKSGVTLSILNSLTQNLIMVLCGVPAFVLFLYNTSGKLRVNSTLYLSILMASLIILGLLYFKLPKLSLRIKKSFLFEEIKKYTDCLSNYKFQDLLKISLVSLVRYLVFCFQFYLMLRFFGVELSEFQAMIAIPTTYLFVTFTPSVSFAEAAVRSSYAVLVIGAFSGQTVNIALAGVFIWVINFVIPMLVGSVVLVRKRM
jgi:hypothetical protein